MSNIDKQAVTAKTKELASLMVERFSMNPVSCKLLNEAWEKEFPDEVAIAERMLALLDELEHYKSREERVTKLVLDNSTSWDALYKKLEAAEKRIAEQREYYEGVIADGSKRIAELEARTVTLPDRKSVIFWPGDADEFDSLGYVIAVRSAIRGAGIGVKGE
ncbi:ead/Ea22-like family protein [Salmonella enterica subsp. enterica serovar Newport]|nr:ead/Ea22-like family protein [Salmonella enterica subsp. enterica serovar Newport]MLT92527.1 ead/Ea22-like family protein [Salmonella enterica subsp. enterica serovar Muenchen]